MDPGLLARVASHRRGSTDVVTLRAIITEARGLARDVVQGLAWFALIVLLGLGCYVAASLILGMPVKVWPLW